MFEFDSKKLARELSLVGSGNTSPQIEIIYNPTSGTGDRTREVEQVAQILQTNGCAVEVSPTKYPTHVTELARKASQRNTDIVFAGGGDGTIHGVVQGLVPGRSVLGIVPWGRLMS